MGSTFSSPYSTYGDIAKVSANGASKETAKQDKLGYHGVSASQTMAETDRERMEKYRTIIYRVAKDKDIHPALIAGIISRESRAGHTLIDGGGDWDSKRGAYNGFGLMQVDVNPNGGNHTAIGEWDSEVHLRQATNILIGHIQTIRNKFPGWCTEQKLKGGIAAYNMGPRNVHSYDRVDENTTGGDYSNDVVARAQWYIDNGFN
ncbi:lysozyme g-like [Solea senegalensis]|uniref:Lysozyme g n=1 Tax=Solea senegalensis TaxID=28829 RepID=A0AAV6Q9J2_SOLSE|nr:lysozyme g-like [Solea senegalensis]KAG7486174.1 lysozyme g-like [Solea senegalensis]